MVHHGHRELIVDKAKDECSNHTQRQSRNCGVPPSICIPPWAGGPHIVVPMVLPQTDDAHQTACSTSHAGKPVVFPCIGVWCCTLCGDRLNETMMTRNRFYVREIQCHTPGSELEHTPTCSDQTNWSYEHKQPNTVSTWQRKHRSKPWWANQHSWESHNQSAEHGTGGASHHAIPHSALSPTTNQHRTGAEASDRERPRSTVRCHLNAQTTVLPKRPETNKGTNLIWHHSSRHEQNYTGLQLW